MMTAVPFGAADRRHVGQRRDLHVVDAPVLQPFGAARGLRVRHPFGPQRNLRLAGAWREADGVDEPLEPRHAIEADANRGAPGRERGKRHRAGLFAHAVHEVGHRGAVVGERRHVPACGRMREPPIEQRQPLLAGSQVGVERPRAVPPLADLEKGPIDAAGFLDVQHPLLFRAAGSGLKDEIDREPRQAGQRVGVDEQAVGGPVERHRRPDLGGHDARRARHGHRVSTNPRDVVHAPHHRVAGRGRGQRPRQHGPHRQREDQPRAEKPQ